MRQYFREMDIDETGLRSSPSLAHLTIFEMTVRILNSPVREEDDGTNVSWYLQQYAANFWLHHFLDIDSTTTAEKDVKLVVESLKVAMDPHGEALRNIELYSDDGSNLFGGATDLREGFLSSVKQWFERAKSLPAGTLSNDALSWMEEFCSSPRQTMIQLARGHISNWFRADRSYKAGKSFEFAQSALRMASHTYTRPAFIC